MKICLTGSTRFMDRYNEANRKLTLAGHIVYTVAVISSGSHIDISAADKEWLDLVHLKKIMESDAVVVIGAKLQSDGRTFTTDSYVGESTRREIRWAVMLNKEIFTESALDLLPRSKDSPRYNLDIPGHTEKEWLHDCKRDHGHRVAEVALSDLLGALDDIPRRPPVKPEDKPS